MAALGTATVKINVVPGEDLERAIRKIVRDEVATIAQRAADSEANCTAPGCQASVPLATLAGEAYRTDIY